MKRKPYYINGGASNFKFPTDLLDTYNSGFRSVALGDFNGDGALDIVLATMGFAGRVYFNDQAGRFSHSSYLPNSVENITDLAVSDLNGDGKLDMAFASPNMLSRVSFNSGSDTFTAMSTLPDSVNMWTRNVALGDLNGDGTPDLVFGKYAAPSQVYLRLRVCQATCRLVTQVGQCWQGHGTAFVSSGCRLPGTLVAWWGAGHAAPWFVLTDLASDGCTAQWYGLRAWCEQCCTCTKRDGWQWQQTQMRDPNRVARIWLAMAVATRWMLTIGSELEVGPSDAWPDLPDRRGLLGLTGPRRPAGPGCSAWAPCGCRCA